MLVGRRRRDAAGRRTRCPRSCPIGLGAKGGEFNKVYMDAFQRIVLRGEPIKDVLAAQAKVLDGLMQETKRALLGARQAEPGAVPGDVADVQGMAAA